MGNKEPLKTDKTENVGDNTKEDDNENSEKKLKDISNTDKETYELTINNNLVTKTLFSLLILSKLNFFDIR